MTYAFCRLICRAVRSRKNCTICVAARSCVVSEVHRRSMSVPLRGSFCPSRLIRSTPEIEEIDINPLVVYPQGKGALALDALIAVAAK